VHPRVLLTAIGFGFVVMFSLVGWVVLGAPGVSRAADQQANGWDGAVMPPGIPPEPFAGLHDQNGNPVSLAAYRGAPVIVTFLYTHCQDECPLTAQQIRQALDRLPTKIPVVAISVDPAHDTNASARSFLSEQGLIGRAHFMLGPRVALQRQWDAYHVQSQLPGQEHTAEVVLLDNNGRQALGFPADKLTPEGLAHDVKQLAASS
jgi:protein SCO1/2